MHIRTDADTVFINQAKEDNFRFITLNLYKEGGTPVDEQQEVAIKMIGAFPGRIAWVTTFSLENFNKDGWQDEVITSTLRSLLSRRLDVERFMHV